MQEKYAKLQSDGEDDKSGSDADAEKTGQDPCDSNDEVEKENEEPNDITDSKKSVIDPARRGTEVKLHNLQLNENVATLQPTNIMLIVQCNRCRNRTELKSPVGQTSSIACAKCNNTQIITFRGGIAHEFSSVIGYIDVDNCSAFDIILPETTYIVGCLSCNKDMKMEVSCDRYICQLQCTRFYIQNLKLPLYFDYDNHIWTF